MDWLWFTICGLLGGILGGMGMGGGTVLIPLLSIGLDLSQHVAQAVNLISFVPMAIIALIIHVKNGLVETSGIWWIIFSGVLSCVAGCFAVRVYAKNLLYESTIEKVSQHQTSQCNTKCNHTFFTFFLSNPPQRYEKFTL